MKKIECDRCGVEIERGLKPYKARRIEIHNGTRDLWAKSDLCVMCAGRLISWLTSPVQRYP